MINPCINFIFIPIAFIIEKIKTIDPPCITTNKSLNQIINKKIIINKKQKLDTEINTLPKKPQQ